MTSPNDSPALAHATGAAGGHPDIDRQVRVYILVFVSLMVLTFVTVAVSRQHLPVATAVTIALIVASIKGSLVACYFMHLISEKRLIYWVLFFTALFFLTVLLLPVFTQMDHVHN